MMTTVLFGVNTHTHNVQKRYHIQISHRLSQKGQYLGRPRHKQTQAICPYSSTACKTTDHSYIFLNMCTVLNDIRTQLKNLFLHFFISNTGRLKTVIQRPTNTWCLGISFCQKNCNLLNGIL